MLLVLLGIGILLWVLTQALRYRSLRSWQVVEGLITQYKVETYEQPQVYILVEKLRPKVSYTYEVDGRKYTGSRITLEDHSLISDSDSIIQPWPSFEINKSHQIYVDPVDPGNSVLIPEILPYRTKHYAALAITGILLMLTGVFFSYIMP